MFKPTLTLIAAACLSLLLSALPAEAQYKLDTVSAWGGSVNAFQKVGTIGYCGSGQRFVVLDMSDEAHIHESGYLNLDTTVVDFAIRGHYAYVICIDNPHRFSVIDIADPQSPRIVWTETAAQPNTRSATRIQIYGNLVYLMYPGSGSVWAYDLTNPASPVAAQTQPPAISSVVTFGDPNGPDWTLPVDFQIVGDYAYIIGENIQMSNGGAQCLSIFNLQPDPLHPLTLVGKVVLTDDVTAEGHLAVADGKAVVHIDTYLPERETEGEVVRIVDVSDPAHPVLTGGYDDVMSARGVAIQGNLAFVADWIESTDGLDPSDPVFDRLKGLAILDVSDPTSPTLLASYNTDHSEIHDVRVDGNRAYVFCDGQGLEILDISDPTQPIRVGGYYSPGALRIMTKDGHRLYAVDEFNGFTILDVSNPNATPVVLGVYRSPGDIRHQGHWNVQVRDNLAYLSTQHGGIEVVDVSDPATPTLVGGYSEDTADFGAQAVELDGDILHVSGQLQANQWFFANFDISNPPEVNLIGAFSAHSFYRRVITTQGITFVGTGVPSIIAGRIDNTDPTSPYMLTGATNDPWGGTDMELVGNTLYVADGAHRKFNIVDVTDPVNAVQIGTYPLSACLAVGVAQDRAYVSCTTQSPFVAGVRTFDISNAASPQSGLVSPAHTAMDIIADGNFVYAEQAYQFFNGEPKWRGGIVVQKYHAACPPNLLTGSGCLGPTDLLSFLTLYFTNYDGQGSAVPGDNQTMPQVNPTSPIYAVACSGNQLSNTPPVVTAAGLKADYDGDCQVGPVDLLHFLTDYFNPASDCFGGCFAAAVAPSQSESGVASPKRGQQVQSAKPHLNQSDTGQTPQRR